MNDEQRRDPRKEMRVRITGRSPAAPISATLLNISETGCKVEAPDFRAEPGATILLDLTPALSVSGQIVWRERGRFGVEFHTEIDEERVASLTPTGPAKNESDRGMKDRFGRQLPELGAWTRARPR